MAVKFKYVNDNSKTEIICDTNVWFGFNQDKPTEVDSTEVLTPTILTLNELATSNVIVHDPKMFQKTIKAIYDHGGPIIQYDPIDYVLNRLDPDYPLQDRGIKELLNRFSKLLSVEIDYSKIDDEVLKNDILEKCKIGRESSNAFAEYANSHIEKIRKNINTGIGKKKHLEIDARDIIKEMVQSIFNDHVKKLNYNIDWENFDWNQIELFMRITETFFKKVETTKGMKIKPNDAVDWLNILYVNPQNKYLTFEGSWRRYIEMDEKIKHYLYK